MAEVVIVSSILNLASEEVRRMIADKLQLLTGVGRELKKLRRTLSAILSVLADAEQRQSKDSAVADWLKKLKNVAYQMEDVLDEAAAAKAPTHKTNQPKRKYKMVRKLFSSLKSFPFRIEIAEKIKKIREDFDEISKDKMQLHLREGVSPNHSDYEVNTGSDEIGSYVDESKVFGRDVDKERIFNFLLSNPNEKNIEVISIVGLGGLGKTTLAQLVCSVFSKKEENCTSVDWQMRSHFKIKIWVNVTQKFELKMVIISIIESLQYQQNRNRKVELPSSIDLLQKRLSELIVGKRFLLVLDNVWTVDPQKWDILRSLLTESCAEGSKVIVTTRDKKVASLMKSNRLHQLEILRNIDDCWELFKKHAFGPDNTTDRNLVVEVSREIAMKCGGLPLALESLGHALYTKDINQWREVKDGEIWTQLDQNHVLDSLRRSYNHLSSSHLKRCFAYCSIFPKGMEIKIKTLEQLWIAEGLVRSSCSISSNGSAHVEELISKSLFESATEDGCIKMHEMVHSLAQFVAGDECLIVDAARENNTNILENTRYTSLVLNGAATEQIANILSNGQKLRTFYLIPNNCGERDIISQNVVLPIVSKVKLLRALHFGRAAINELPKKVESLVHLRYLDLSSTNLDQLPQIICHLHYLQTLNLRFTRLERLPDSIGDLVNLLTLDISGCEAFHSLPDTIGSLKDLQHLDLSNTVLQTLPCTIGSLKSLLTLDISGCEAFHSLPDTIGNLKDLQHLDLSNTKLQTLPRTIGSLESLLILNISGCETFHSLPDTIGNLKHLQHLDLSNTVLQTLPCTICVLKKLLTLDLRGCSGLHLSPDTERKLSSFPHLNLLRDCPPIISSNY